MPFDTVLALLLITSTPVGYTYHDAPNMAHYSYLRGTCRQLALEMELMDPREAKFIFEKEEDFSNDLRIVQRRHQELHDAPHSYDGYKFPSREACNDLLAFNRAYRAGIELKIALTVDQIKQYELREVIIETDQLYEIWDTVRDANCEYYYITVRRNALKKLKDKLGNAYYDGALPPHVPLWRFQRID